MKTELMETTQEQEEVGERKEEEDKTTTPKKEKEEEDDECPICLDEVSLLSNFKRFTCCGKVLHTHCCTDLMTSKMKWNCPLCRAKTPTSAEKAVAQLHPWVKKKKAWALTIMGEKYRDGTGVKQTYKKARKLFELAAQQGYALAMTGRGFIYLHGRGVERSYERAKEYFEQAAQLGHADAQYNLGAMYANGMVVERDMAKSKACWTQPAAQGEKNAIKQLTMMF
jgi:hypothetical protein